MNNFSIESREIQPSDLLEKRYVLPLVLDKEYNMSIVVHNEVFNITVSRHDDCCIINNETILFKNYVVVFPFSKRILCCSYPPESNIIPIIKNDEVYCYTSIYFEKESKEEEYLRMACELKREVKTLKKEKESLSLKVGQLESELKALKDKIKTINTLTNI